MIDQQRCLECGRATVLRFGPTVYRCSHCRYRPFLDAALANFSAAELDRLEAYRRAVAAGFYHDW